MQQRSFSGSARAFVKQNGSFVMFLLICLIASLFIPRFASLSNFALVIKQAAIPIIGCLGMTCVLMTGGHQGRKRLEVCGVPVVDGPEALYELLFD